MNEKMQNYKLYATTFPSFVAIQKTSFCWFISNGLGNELSKFSSIHDFTGNIEVYIFGQEYKLKKPKYNEFESKQQDVTYSANIFLPVEIRNDKSNIICTKKSVFIGTLPLMTDKATFIINGCERVIISQIIRSPGVYINRHKNHNFYEATLISSNGSWLNFKPEYSKSDKKHISIQSIYVYIDKFTKIDVVQLLKNMGLNFESIYQISKYPEFVKTLTKSLEALENSEDNQTMFSKLLNLGYLNIGKIGRLKLNQKLNLHISDNLNLLTYQDIINIIDLLFITNKNNGPQDDVDHLQNKTVRSVGELLGGQVYISLKRLDRILKDRLTLCDPFKLTINTVIDPKPLITLMKQFFGSSQLSQFMDQTNPLSALTHKRRMSLLGPGGLNRDRISFVVRDIHPSHYGRICPIETPEGQNAGLIGSLTTCGRANKYGFLETPFWKVINGYVVKTGKPFYLTADIEDYYKIATADLLINSKNEILSKSVTVRYKQNFINVSSHEIDFIPVSTIQVLSPAAALIPFLEHDDANRALMGSNMQRQAVPLLFSQKPIIGTGLENQVAIDSGMAIVSIKKGVVTYVSSDSIVIKDFLGNEIFYDLEKYQKSNQDTCFNNKPIVWVGEHINKGQIIADGPGTKGGELSLGQNLIVAYMPWDGYNFEDAILINERLVYDDIFTSVHIEKYEVEIRQVQSSTDIVTRNIPYTNASSIQNLDDNGIIKKGTFVKPGDILVGKVTPKIESEQLPEEKLLRAIFGEKAKDVRDTSLRVPAGEYGRILDIRVFDGDNGDELAVGTEKLIKVRMAQVRKIQVGDKIAGRHGNKGIISRILARQDMPYLPDGTPVDIILNPLGVPSRMNVGQLYECLLGFSGDKLNRRFKILPFDEMYKKESSRILISKKLRDASIFKNQSWIFNPYSPGKMILTDGRTGNYFENPITVGKAYMLKLIHLVDDKIHARSTGPYSLVTQQPLGGKSRNGGQRFGEMEVWALEAYGAAHTLQELLTVKSDDMAGRNDLFAAILNNEKFPSPGIPESFKVLLRELQSMGLDINTYKMNVFGSNETYVKKIDLMKGSTANLRLFSPVTNDINLTF
jgi:DNA-directed RNA polymerase subunit beta